MEGFTFVRSVDHIATVDTLKRTVFLDGFHWLCFIAGLNSDPRKMSSPKDFFCVLVKPVLLLYLWSLGISWWEICNDSFQTENKQLAIDPARAGVREVPSSNITRASGYSLSYNLVLPPPRAPDNLRLPYPAPTRFIICLLNLSWSTYSICN